MQRGHRLPPQAMGLATLVFLHLNDSTMRGRYEHLVVQPQWQLEAPTLGRWQGLHRFLNESHLHAVLRQEQYAVAVHWHLREGQYEPMLHRQSMQFDVRQ